MRKGLILILLLCVCSFVYGFSVRVTWRHNSEKDLAYYTVYKGTVTGKYNSFVRVPKTDTSYVFTGLRSDSTYFTVITATDSSLNESGFSAEARTDTLDFPPNPPVMSGIKVEGLE